MTDSNNKATTQTPMWDGKDESWSLWNVKFHSLAVYHDCEMKDCPTKTEYKGLELTQTDGKRKANLCKSITGLVAIFTLGQQTAHGLGYLEQTKTDDFPSEIVYRALELIKIGMHLTILDPKFWSRTRSNWFHLRMLGITSTLSLPCATSTVPVRAVLITSKPC